MSKTRQATIQRSERGRFKKGFCPNPLGRKPVDKTIREWMSLKSEDLLGILYKKAFSGDIRAIKIWLDKCLPNMQSVTVLEKSKLENEVEGSMFDSVEAVRIEREMNFIFGNYDKNRLTQEEQALIGSLLDKGQGRDQKQ